MTILKSSLLITMLIVAIGCGKEVSQSTTQPQFQAPVQASKEVCEELAADLQADMFIITAPGIAYVLKDGAVSKWNVITSNEVVAVGTEDLNLDGFCTLEVLDGVLSRVTMPSQAKPTVICVWTWNGMVCNPTTGE